MRFSPGGGVWLTLGERIVVMGRVLGRSGGDGPRNAPADVILQKSVKKQ